jgi:hypothetical protein
MAEQDTGQRPLFAGVLAFFLIRVLLLPGTENLMMRRIIEDFRHRDVGTVGEKEGIHETQFKRRRISG